MAITYGGIPLKGNDREVDALVEQYLPTREVYEFEDWPTPYSNCLTWHGYVPNLFRPVKVGHLWWPRDASRWAVAHFLITDNDLDLIRPLAQPVTGYQALPLELSGRNGNTVTADMWMLPPRPLAKIAGTNGLRLLTLVDSRYFYWMATTGAMAAATTWAALFSAIGTMLGVSISTDAIASAYGTPAQSLVSQYEYVPPLLDAASYCCGMRFVRSYAGACSVRGWSSAQTLQATQMADGTATIMGGNFDLST